ncbi:hypothetical protein JW898_02190 [Candidatus Woesearchaeota archaeon]|nr:hypothetical protein [Candidatus Woesearchaeota archaeon]
MADGESSKRQVAYKVRVADIINNRYVKEEGWLPNYVSVGGRKVSRANLLGVIVSRSVQDDGVVSQSFVLDDGSGRVSLRFFDSPVAFDVGDIVTVIGRPREFGAERYIVPEIMKKVLDQKWVELRRMELTFDAHLRQKVEEEHRPDVLSVEKEDLVDEPNASARLLDEIRKLDSGLGVGFDDISSVPGGDVESALKRLLEQGDIFEVRPGRYKVLE